MKREYKISLIIYSSILIGFLSIIVLFSLAMKENVELHKNLILLIIWILFTVTYLATFPYLIKKISKYKFIIAILNLLFIIASLTLAMIGLLQTDLSTFMIIITGALMTSGFVLIYNSIKELQKVKDKKNLFDLAKE